ncbi:Oxidoreductase molybdopterin binding domain-containing protein [Chitinophaga sp. YR573]|uniref:molybdopterin-dependent oxidoreductase n=1 Tax=Chitinophaga sp. YR573 TaxID=1881040 RepID=UPI0008C5C1FB|nr:molybdopterin-dependent oxidoreductase [Chitinophaga sp. YR573]SEV95448.1 Oxidoreductase molybdopterin binding domain-containing protein [Chitinophaga sp. YR573]
MKYVYFLLLVVFYTPLVWGQSTEKQPTVTVKGEVTHPLNLGLADLANMRRVEVRSADRDGKEHLFSGVPLSDILRQAGVTLGAELRGENMAKYLLVKSGDGYKVLFSLPELDSTFTNRVIILADKMDGNPLPANKGPFRVIVPGEKKPARWIWEVTTMIVQFAKE